MTHDLYEVSVMFAGSAALHLVSPNPEIVAAALRAYAEAISPAKTPKPVMRG